jgi:cytochrome b pre-mRNA-processing protein 3
VRPGDIILSLLKKLFAGGPDRAEMLPLYNAVVAAGRDPAWYLEGGVPDTLDGRFDILAALMALMLLRLEREPSRQVQQGAAMLTELFVDDMDGTLRQIGIGDLVVGKHMGRMVGALGGRLGAFRTAGSDANAFRAAVKRNIFHETPPSEAALDHVAGRLANWALLLDGTQADSLLAGRMPTP